MKSAMRKFLIILTAAVMLTSMAVTANAKIVAVYFEQLDNCGGDGGWIVVAVNEECGTAESTVLCDGG